MRYADQALEDETLLLIIQQESAKRCKKSKTRGLVYREFTRIGGDQVPDDKTRDGWGGNWDRRWWLSCMIGWGPSRVRTEWLSYMQQKSVIWIALGTS